MLHHRRCAHAAAATGAPTGSPCAALGPLGPGRAGSASRRRARARSASLPPFHSRKHLPSRLARLRELDGRSAVRVRGQGTEFDSLREYVRGDDVRCIDWRASARNRNVVVRTWQPERDRRVVLVLDTSRTSAGRVDDVPRLDSAMDAALLLAALAARAGDRVDFLAGDRRVRARVRAAGAPRRRRATCRTRWPTSSRCSPRPTGRALAGAVVRARPAARARRAAHRRSSPSAVEEGLLPVLPTLTRHHRVVLASVRDPALDRLAADRGDARRGVRRGRRRAGAGRPRRAPPSCWRALGVDVVDADAERPAGARWPTTT